MIDLNKEKGAVFSANQNYRFVLWRTWNNRLPKVLFIGLNPSTANASSDDATTRKVISFAKKNGFGGVVLGNCFPYVATNPKDLVDFYALEENDRWLQLLKKEVIKVVFAWGNFKVIQEKNRDVAMSKIFPQAKILSANKNGSPKHPLYAKLDVVLQDFTLTPSPKNKTKQYA